MCDGSVPTFTAGSQHPRIISYIIAKTCIVNLRADNDRNSGIYGQLLAVAAASDDASVSYNVEIYCTNR